jgi:hypothetical protein
LDPLLVRAKRATALAAGRAQAKRATALASWEAPADWADGERRDRPSSDPSGGVRMMSTVALIDETATHARPGRYRGLGVRNTGVEADGGAGTVRVAVLAERYQEVWEAAFERARSDGFTAELSRFRASEAVREARASDLGIIL